MTTNQIAYFRAREEKRHNLAQEAYQSRNLDEAVRHNVASEFLDRYRADISYQSSIYSADSQRAASKYSADSARAASQYSADRAYAANIYSADRHYQSSVYAANKSYAASVYNTKMNYLSSLYSTDRKTEVETFKAVTSMQSAANVANINSQASKTSAQIRSDADERINTNRLISNEKLQNAKMQNDMVLGLITGGMGAFGHVMGGVLSMVPKI